MTFLYGMIGFFVAYGILLWILSRLHNRQSNSAGYGSTAQWFASDVIPHLTFLAAIPVAYFAYRFSQAQTKLLDRQIQLDENRVPVTFTFRRRVLFDPTSGNLDDWLEIEASTGLYYELSMEVRTPLNLNLYNSGNQRQITLLFVESYYHALAGPEDAKTQTFSLRGYTGNLGALSKAIDWLSEPIRQSQLQLDLDWWIAPVICTSFVQFDGTTIVRYYGFSVGLDSIDPASIPPRVGLASTNEWEEFDPSRETNIGLFTDFDSNPVMVDSRQRVLDAIGELEALSGS